MNNQEKIAELKKELAKLQEIDAKKLTKYREKKEIANLKKEIREKKFAGLKRTGRNLKIIGKNTGKIMGNIGSGVGKVLGQLDDQTEQGKKKAKRSVQDVINSLPA